MAERRLAARGVRFLRGGAFKLLRTEPVRGFQGHGVEALAWMREAADATGMKVVTEALSEADLSAVAEHADMIQVGSRNMQNFALLKAVGRTKRPVLLKRAMAGTIEEWLSAGEYLLASGAPGVVFCERGVRGFDVGDPQRPRPRRGRAARPRARPPRSSSIPRTAPGVATW